MVYPVHSQLNSYSFANVAWSYNTLERMSFVQNLEQIECLNDIGGASRCICPWAQGAVVGGPIMTERT